MFVNETFLQELKSKIIIEDIVSNYVSLKKRGSNAIGICPFHNEKTPSFTVYNDTQSFYCYGCATGGDAITFLQKIENIDFIDAVRLLTQYVGVNMPDDVADDNNWGQKKRRILEINRESAKFFHDYMMTSPKKSGLNYWHNRNITQSSLNPVGIVSFSIFPSLTISISFFITVFSLSKVSISLNFFIAELYFNSIVPISP